MMDDATSDFTEIKHADVIKSYKLVLSTLLQRNFHITYRMGGS